MHSMFESATLRASKRRRTEHHINHCAQQLTEAHGLDGFTMDDLAEAAEVSRRTLFNYFPSKLDAVLGNMPVLSASALATFEAGGPHGDLVDDLGELARVIFTDEGLSREQLELSQRVFFANPRLIVTAHERFEAFSEALVEHILAREGADFGRARARLLMRLLVAVFDSSLVLDPSAEGRGARGTDGSDEDGAPDVPDRPLADVFSDHLATARALLA